MCACKNKNPLLTSQKMKYLLMKKFPMHAQQIAYSGPTNCPTNCTTSSYSFPNKQTGNFESKQCQAQCIFGAREANSVVLHFTEVDCAFWRAQLGNYLRTNREVFTEQNEEFSTGSFTD